MNGWLAKIGGWALFGLTALSQIGSNQPHGWQGWLQTIGALVAAVGIHAASNVGQVVSTASTTTTFVGSAHVKQ
jgi:hypothetical protein